jgi:predicted double-glycine peptidase
MTLVSRMIKSEGASLVRPLLVFSRICLTILWVGLWVGGIVSPLRPLRADAGVLDFVGPEGLVTVPARSYKELKFATVVRQQFDFSCGSAAVATLLTYEFKRPTSETEAFKAMFKVGDQAKIRKKGFSLLDIKRYLLSIGYTADGYRISLERLAELRLPAIVLIQTHGYRHFVVIKGIEGGYVLIGDPARGLRREDLTEFKKLWVNQIVFVIHRGKGLFVSRQSFNDKREWAAVSVDIPVSMAQNQLPLATQLLLVPGPNQIQFGGFAKIGIP